MHPEAFTPDLSRSLTTKTSIQRTSGRLEAARDDFHLAIRYNGQSFLERPAVLAQLTGSLCQEYVECCSELETEPDLELLSPIVAEFEKLEGQTARGEGEGG
jgi:hypothetical protein